MYAINKHKISNVTYFSVIVKTREMKKPHNLVHSQVYTVYHIIYYNLSLLTLYNYLLHFKI